MMVASIDIGTNTVLLLIARVESDGAIIPVVDLQRVPRLGRGVDAARNLHPAAMQRVVDVLKEYRGIIEEHGATHIVACATSAVRDAANGAHFLRLAREAAGLEVEVLNGDDEALWSYRGAVHGMKDLERATVLDIGGGSTEIVVGDRDRICDRSSLDIGAVRITERIFRHDPPLPEELRVAEELVQEELGRLTRFPFRDSTLIGVAGTVTALAATAQALPEYRREAVAGYRLEGHTVEELFDRFRSLPAADIRRLSGVMEGRADVITAGTLILRAMMQRFSFPALLVSERGIRYGLVLKHLQG
jgi:exopolyphosphatase / guanosine-5'-triphosphate,3'-diphosphate pyrophosphatase